MLHGAIQKIKVAGFLWTTVYVVFHSVVTELDYANIKYAE